MGQNKKEQQDGSNIFQDDNIEEPLVALIAILEARDEFTKEHSMRVSSIASRLAQICKVDAELRQKITRAAMLHDIGMVSVPDAILLKPGHLTPDERKLIQATPHVAVKILKSIKSLKDEREMILHHGERWDGSGYPDGLKGNDIPLGSRFITIAKAIDAMTQNRAYRRARSLSFCLDQLQQCSGTQFDPQIANIAKVAMGKGLLRSKSGS